MKLNDGSNFFYNLLLGLGGMLHFLGIRSAFRDKKIIEEKDKKISELQQQLQECQKKPK